MNKDNEIVDEVLPSAKEIDELMAADTVPTEEMPTSEVEEKKPITLLDIAKEAAIIRKRGIQLKRDAKNREKQFAGRPGKKAGRRAFSGIYRYDDAGGKKAKKKAFRKAIREGALKKLAEDIKEGVKDVAVA